MRRAYKGSGRQMVGLNKLGDALIPGDNTYPSFSVCGCGEHVERLLSAVPEVERRTLRQIWTIASFCPVWVLKVGVWALEKFVNEPDRMVHWGRRLWVQQRTLLTSMYYCGLVGESYKGPSPLELMGYSVSVCGDDAVPRPDGPQRTHREMPSP